MSHPVPGGITASLQRAREILRIEGPRSLWFKLLGETIYRRMLLIECDIRPVAGSGRSTVDLDCRRMTVGEVGEYLDFRADADRHAILRRLEKGDICFLVREQGLIIHCCWTATRRATIDYLECNVQLASGVVYVYEVFTAPQARGHSISSARSFAMEKYFVAEGYHRLLAVVWPENRPVFQSLYKVGYAVVGRIGYWGVGRFRRYFCHYAGNDPPLKLGVVRRDSFREAPATMPPGYGGGYWDQVSQRLEGRPHYLDPFLGQLKRQEYLRLVHEWGGLRTDGRLLKTDVFEEAMGADAFLVDLSEELGETIGMDVSLALTRWAAERFSGHAVRFLAADVRSLPFADTSFSTVVSPSTLDHFPDPADLGVSLRELFRVLEPGGRLVITLDNRQNVFDPVLRLVHRLGMVPYYMGRSYTVSELRSELCEAGFVVQETTAILHNPRLVAVAAMRLVRWLRWQPLINSVERLSVAAQGLEKTRWCYYTGSFVAALAIRPADDVKIKNQI